MVPSLTARTMPAPQPCPTPDSAHGRSKTGRRGCPGSSMNRHDDMKKGYVSLVLLTPPDTLPALA
jgi:hypothetical protein